jgi:predicted DNA binding protein
MVCLAFHGARPEGYHAAHRNGIVTDNRASNLRWATKVQNEADKIAHDVRAWGSRHGMHKLTDDQVKFIRANYLIPGADLARRFGVSQTTISSIRHRKSWRHL